MPLALGQVGQDFSARVEPGHRFALIETEEDALHLVLRSQLRRHERARRLDALAAHSRDDRDVGTPRRHLLDLRAAVGVGGVDLVPDFDLRNRIGSVLPLAVARSIDAE